MQGSMSLARGVLYVGRHEQTAHVQAFDLDGRALSPGFSFGDVSGRAEASGIDVDGEHTIWIADRPAGRVRAFTLFGAEVGSIGGSVAGDAPGSTQGVVDVAVTEVGGEPALLVAREGVERHAVQLFSPEGRWIRSLRSEGSPLKEFRDVSRIAVLGELTYVCETGPPGRVQVFRSCEFHFRFPVRDARGLDLEPRALAPLPDGRLVVATGGARSALLLLDSSGRVLEQLAGSSLAPEAGCVFEPDDVVVEPEADPRIAVLDCDGERVQVFTLAGRCYGAFQSLPGA